MYKTNFEASDFFRGVLKDEFRLKEFIFEDDNYSVILWKHPLYKTLISTPYRDRLALVYKGGTPKKINYAAICEKFKGYRIILKDIGLYLSADQQELSLNADFLNSDILLDPNLEKNFKYCVRKNLKRGVNIHNLAFEVNRLDYFEQFYRLHLKTRKRLGVIPYKKSFFKSLIQNGVREKVAFFSCKYNNSVAASLICYLHDDEMISGHLAYDYSCKELRANDFLLTNAFIWGRKNQYRIFRFGADYKEQASLLKFKQKFGAKVRSQLDFYSPCRNSESLGPARNAGIKKIIGLLPDFLYRLIDNATRIYFA